jgi:hypothetical protein
MGCYCSIESVTCGAQQSAHPLLVGAGLVETDAEAVALAPSRLSE